jgi:ABC-type glycerol-3-phosphate transport system substrate-binding protein
MTTTKKYLGGITAALVLTVGLAACGSRTETSTPSTPSTKAPATTTTTENVFESASQSELIDALVEVYQEEFPGTSRSTVIDVAKTACEAIEAQGSIVDAMAAIAVDPDIDATMAGDMAFVMGVSVPVYCPQFLPELNRLTN